MHPFFYRPDIALVIVIPVIYYILKAISKKIELDKNYFNLIFIIHSTVIFIFITFLQTDDGDTIKYFEDSKNFNHYTFVFGSQFIQFIGSIFIKFLKFDFYSLNFLFGSFGTLGLLLIGSIILKKNEKFEFRGFNLFFLLLLIPSMNFFTSSIGKDSLVFFGICLLIWTIENYNSKKLSLIFLSFALIFFARLHVGLILFFVFSIFYVFIFYEYLKKKNFVYSKIFIIVLAIILSIIIVNQIIILKKIGIISELGGTSATTKLFDINYLFNKFDVYSRNTMTANSSYKQEYFNFDLYFYIKYLLGPMYSNPKSFFHIIMIIENLNLLIILLLTIFFYGSNLRSNKVKLNDTIYLLFFILITYTLSLATSNYGVAIRQKATLYPILIFIFYNNISTYLNEKKNSTNHN